MSCVEIPKVGSRKAKSPAKKTSYEDCVPFNQFMKQFEVGKEKGLPYTHTSITPAKKYYVGNDDRPEMEKLYKEALERDENWLYWKNQQKLLTFVATLTLKLSSL